MSGLKAIAARVLREHGLDFADAQRLGGWTNHVWVAGDAVLRVSPNAGGDRIRREAALAGILPKEVGYPENIALGVIDDHEWSLSRRVSGVNLSDAWKEMDWKSREDTMQLLFLMLQALHATDASIIPVELPKHPWYSSLSPADARADTDGLLARGILSPEQADAVNAVLARFFDALPRAKPSFIHGDITGDNMLWHSGKIACLMDLEHAAIAPKQIDLHNYLRFAFGPESAEEAQSSAERDQFLNTVTRLVRPAIASADDAVLLVGFGVLIAQRRVHIWLGGGNTDYENWEPYRSLLMLINGRGGYLEPVVAGHL